MESWDVWVEAALSRLASKNLIAFIRPISLSRFDDDDPIETFDGPSQWDRSSVEVEVDEATFRQWLGQQLPSPANEMESSCEVGKMGRKLILFSGNDYLGLSAHPSVSKAAVKAAQKHGMGPRGSSVVCGYTSYHGRLEAALAGLKKKEGCLLCPTGYAANVAFMTALGSVSSLSVVGRKPSKDERVAIFSDALNHASIIDGIRLAEQQQQVEVFIYRHCDMGHLNTLLSYCKSEKKVVITDSIFSMDGDFAKMVDLVKLRKKHGFLLVIDDAHGTLVCGANGGGIQEVFGCENEVDVCIGTLSKAIGCQGGFIACSNRWKQLIQTRGRSFIFTTSSPVPIVAASHAALFVGTKEKWRTRELWRRVHDFNLLTNLRITSPIISLVVGTEESAILASRHMLRSGFHVTAIGPPAVPSSSCRLRITLCSAHTTEDIRRLVAALSHCISFPVAEQESDHVPSKL